MIIYKKRWDGFASDRWGRGVVYTTSKIEVMKIEVIEYKVAAEK